MNEKTTIYQFEEFSGISLQVLCKHPHNTSYVPTTLAYQISETRPISTRICLCLFDSNASPFIMNIMQGALGLQLPIYFTPPTVYTWRFSCSSTFKPSCPDDMPKVK